MESRPYGSTGINLSVVGFGGIVVMDETPADADRYVAEAIDRGVSYFDVAPSYGNAEERLGPALEPFRDRIFLACKTGVRDASGARASLEASLKKLRTDRFDLFQLHAVTTDEDVRTVLGPGGALETLVKAREEGLIRHIGFSAHTEKAALALLDAFAFDSVLFPVNWASWLGAGFGPAVVDAARLKGISVLALKALAVRALGKDEARSRPKAWYIPADNYEDAALGLRFTLSRPGVVAALSPGHADLFRWACDAGDRLEGLSAADEASLAERARALTPVFPIEPK
ncbi:MAG: oxidoreductase [Treponema sp. GWB1_62_6]|nr:MAG: oxidoreductase [Treponema sp. GWC1_61_84]OHE67231.1 MAG: oxidoreductase [Treponema sp. GWA1_62_8]OHE70092.1 MAG: oxidoreductase [Treponema sp. RIFOXYC1_FULL_61_9]OHE70826.1 MAG: oxidoreductase [Treponema sp. GWB1_62_6]HCM28695.1 oxidoreductase [Treponema sp.]